MLEFLPIVLILVFFLSLCFLFSGLETGMMSIDQIALEDRARRSKRDAALLKFIRQPDKLLGTTLIGSNVASAVLASIATLFAGNLKNFDARFTALIVGTIVLIFGEIVPKAVFREHSEKLVTMLFPLLLVFYYMLKPFVAVVGAINTLLMKLFKVGDGNQYDFLTKEDISFLLAESNEDSPLSTQMEMIEDALDLRDQKAKNIMEPRTEIVAIEDITPIPEVRKIAQKEGFTRYPVYRNSIDDIIGVLIVYDMLKKEVNDEMTAGDIIHEPLFAPESIGVDKLLHEMQSQRKSMAIIVDSFGGTAGIVTIEDILEEIVGDIEDEYDEEEERDVEQISPNTWIAMADVEIDRLADDYDIILPEGDYETIAGLILDTLEKIPHQGQFINVEPYRIQVLQATDKKIIKVKIHKQAR
ncbi:MAG: hemolysin family protein [Candidatus Cloacimonetes bacterium]|jgi:CBS domain containing-hemolysin-like protein|nr:hemolysin family protein [Candidatus Cloacimonadota bacterium]NLO44406.1 HlyC/CorC family transporter [Candidatus Cloacimonadota bacterium]